MYEENIRIEPRQHNGWRLITPCIEDLPSHDEDGNLQIYTIEDIVAVCPLFYESSEFDNRNFKSFQTLLQKMMRVAAAGHDWQSAMTDDVHDAGGVSIRRVDGRQETHTIIQFGIKTTLVRIHAITTAAGRKVAFISHTFVKPANKRKTPPSEQKRVQRNLEEYLHAIDTNSAQLIDIQGGRDGFLRLV